MADIAPDTALEMLRTMVLIRETEETLVRLFAQGRLPGFIHSYIGQEATAVGVCAALRSDDYITSTHRGHGHILAKGGDLNRFFAELYGKATGYCLGKGGSMHVADLDLGILGANGIVGGGIAIAAGAGLAAKMQGLDRVAVSFMGDGATDIGSFHEALNLASLWAVPVVFVCENNGFAEFVSVREHQKIEHIADRAASYAMPGVTVDGNDVIAVYQAAGEAVDRARAGEGPTLLECVTLRWRGHFEGDPESYRSKEELKEGKRADPIRHLQDMLRATGAFDDDAEATIRDDVATRIQRAIEFAESSPLPAPQDALVDVYTDLVEEGW
jgi:TPP-dependent pyruvate/acetoin dehydrogenase alpha subunit